MISMVECSYDSVTQKLSKSLVCCLSFLITVPYLIIVS